MSGDPYESGPFCRHWNELGYCDERCSRCGHLCGRHEYDDTQCNECECPGWVETIAENTPDISPGEKETPT